MFYVAAVVGFGSPMVWFPLSTILFCPWTRETEFTEAALIVPSERVSDSSG